MNAVRHPFKGCNFWICIVVLLATCLSGCNTVPYERGAIWCNAPLTYGPGKHFDDTHLDVARNGYMYALAAALALQGNTKEASDHWFAPPDRLREEKSLYKRDNGSGFEVRTFELRNDPDDAAPSEIIIAFVGSNDAKDWVLANLLFSRAQYDLARDHVKKISERYSGKRLVVTGYSLGGALAGHVTKHKDTKKFVTEAWLFNPSPKLYTHDDYDKRIWLAAMRGEILRLVRSDLIRYLWPGVNRIGAPAKQDAHDYYLITSTSIYGHYRWTLARNILFVADYAHLQNKLGPVNPLRADEPRNILLKSRFKACEAEEAWAKHIEGKRAAVQLESQMKIQQEALANEANAALGK